MVSATLPRRGPLVPSMCQANFDVWEAYWFRFHPRGQRARTRVASSLTSPAETKNAPGNDSTPVDAAAPAEACIDAKTTEARSLEQSAEVSAAPQQATETQTRKLP